jgi:uncharacterized membrane protein YecN with MAPEG domain
MKIAIICTAVLALMQAALGLGVSAMRRKHRISVGAPPDPDHPLSRIRTAFSNCAEWHPLLMLLTLMQAYGGPAWSIWLPALVVAARCLMVVGLTTYPNSRPNLFRVLGAAGTYAMTFLLSVMIIVTYWPAPMGKP